MNTLAQRGISSLGATSQDALVGTPIGVTMGIGLIGAAAGGVLGAVLPTKNRYKAAAAGALLGTGAAGTYESITRWRDLDATYGGAYKTARWAIMGATALALVGGALVAWRGK